MVLGVPLQTAHLLTVLLVILQKPKRFVTTLNQMGTVIGEGIWRHDRIFFLVSIFLPSSVMLKNKEKVWTVLCEAFSFLIESGRSSKE